MKRKYKRFNVEPIEISDSDIQRHLEWLERQMAVAFGISESYLHGCTKEGESKSQQDVYYIKFNPESSIQAHTLELYFMFHREINTNIFEEAQIV